MAVSPALTYPSKRLKVASPSSTAERVRLMVTARALNILASAAPTRLTEPHLFYRGPVVATAPEANTARRAYMMVASRAIRMSASAVVIRTFPIPYLARLTTRPSYGEQWPRFAVYGSTV